MESRDSVEYIQKEHLEIVRLAEKIADALALVSKDDFAARRTGLVALRSTRDGLLGILQHCHADDSIVETDFHRYLDANQYGQLRAQHAAISRLVAGLLRELPYVTADTVVDLRTTGEELLEQIRQHIAYEADMLWRVEDRRLQYQ